MGTLILVSGANSSGKSRYAEQLVAATRGPRYYIATMVAQTEENRHRIEKHRRQRQELNFTTLEVPFGVGAAAVTEDSVVLLEDASNLLANTVFAHGGDGEKTLQDILALSERCRLLIVVTISGMRPEEYQGETADYIRSMNELNRRLFEAAAAAVELENGVPHWRKGEPDAID